MIKKRQPVVAVMGHIDHGKSSLLSYIRNNQKEILSEAGGITQHISSYEVSNIKNHPKESITFLDTPGHEAFNGIRNRGAKIADIAVLVVSSEDGVKPQTIEAFKMIKNSNTPFIVAITKIDKPESNIEKTKMSLAENEIYLEGYGGTISFVPVSAKTGEGIDQLLDMILLTAEVEDLKTDTDKPAEGVIVEARKDPRKGIIASCIIKDGVLRCGQFVACEKAISPLRIMEDCFGTQIKEAIAGKPVNIVGFSELPKVGEIFKSFENKKDAEELATKENLDKENTETIASEISVPIIIKTDTSGSMEAILYEIKKLSGEKISLNVIGKGIGNITETDVKNANGENKALIIGFGIKMDNQVKLLAEKFSISINIFNIIYKMSEWLKIEMENRIPKDTGQEILGKAKILKTFSKSKDKQIVGGTVEEGEFKVGNNLKILRRDETIAFGKLKNLQMKKTEVESVDVGKEFGAMIDCKIEIVPGDSIVASNLK